MIEKMTKYSFVLLKGEEEKFLEQLRELGVVDIKRSSVPVDDHSTELMERIGQVKHEIESLENGVDTHLTELIEQRRSLEDAKEVIAPWGDYDRDKADALGKAGVPIHFFCVRKKAFDPAWEADYPLEVICDDGKKIHFVIAGDVSGFPVAEMHSPLSTIHELEGMLKNTEKDIERYRKHLEDRKSEIPELEERRKDLTDELNIYLASLAGESAVEDRLTVYEGFAPSEVDAKLADALDESDALWLKDTAALADNPPIKLKNNKFVKMFEVLTDMYGRPSYDGFDPTPFLSIFFLLFFALCMGDAGYGLILILVGIFMKKVKSFKDMAPLVITLGIGTLVVGFFMHTFFSNDISQWKIFQPIKGIFLPAEIAGYDGAMVLSLMVGILHLCLAMIVKTYIATRNNGFLESLGTWGWTLLIVGGVIVAGIALAGVIDASVTKWIVIALGVVSALGIFVFNNIHRNPLVNIGSGLWDTYNTATGLLGDVLSYLRLYALGLAGAMLGYAFNDLGKMVLGDGHSIAPWIGFIVIVVIGHTLNIAMCALGAFVHPLRLNFLEFFKNSGYEGSGRNFNPLK
ncbi:MAG: ATPase V [Bacteroidales bacterium]|nr:ATPase V [Bacteroidales bacterium]